jgi:hypothetical protein
VGNRAWLPSDAGLTSATIGFVLTSVSGEAEKATLIL